MDQITWATAIQALIIAISTLVIRSRAKSDKEEVKHSTASSSELAAVRADILDLQRDLEILKTAFFKCNPAAIDHRGPNPKG